MLPLSRRDFLIRSSAALVTASLLTRSIASAQMPKAGQPPVTPEFKSLRREVGYFTARGGTIGWLAGPSALAAVDTQFPDTAKMFLDGLPSRGGSKLDVLVNSHHHGDHTGGNGVFKPETKTIVAHANVPRLQRAAAERAKNVDSQVYADTTFADTWRLDLGAEVMSARYFGPAHTSGDIVTLFEKANVIHVGDLMFNRMYPVIDRPAGASIRGWIGILEKITKNYPADAIYVYGHGNAKFGVSGRSADLLVFRDYLSGLLDYVQRRIQAGASKEEIVALDNLPGFSDFHVPPGPQNRLPLNLGVAYDELTQKKV